MPALSDAGEDAGAGAVSPGSAAGEPAPEPRHAFSDSRRLTGPSRGFAGTAVTLCAEGPLAADPAAHARWAAQVQALCLALGWPPPQPLATQRRSETRLSFAAPADLLFTATEVNEWAWEAACRGPALDGFDLAHPWAVAEGDTGADPVAVPTADLNTASSDGPGRIRPDLSARFSARAAAELNPALQALRRAAALRDLPVLVDDEVLSLGSGCGSSSWWLNELPALHEVPWSQLHDVPTALVTGSNGKTTTVRLLAAMAACAGVTAGHCSTEAVVVGGQPLQQGDYAGPAGARAVLRDRRVQLAVLETARGGLLRRGLALDRADVAVVTNLAADHFGEYGIESLDDLAEVKLVVARALPAGRGLLVLNADDAVLMAAAARLPHAAQARLGLFAQDHDHPALVTHREHEGATCGVDAQGRLQLHAGGAVHTLGAAASLPLSLGGAAAHNIANAAAAALAAWGLALAPHHIAAALQHFGTDPADNPGRLERHTWRGATVLLDYAHNPEGLAQLLQVARRLLAAAGTVAAAADTGSTVTGRLGLLLGQAGNRDDDAIAALAHTAAGFQPARVVVKELPDMRRGRPPGEVSALLAQALQTAGLDAARVALQPDEEAAALDLLAWARPGDVVVLPVHTAAVRARLAQRLNQGAAP